MWERESWGFERTILRRQTNNGCGIVSSQSLKGQDESFAGDTLSRFSFLTWEFARVADKLRWERGRVKLRSSLNTGKCLTYLMLDGKQNSRGFLAEDLQTCGRRGVPWNVKRCSRKIRAWSTHSGKYALGLQKVYKYLQGETSQSP